MDALVENYRELIPSLSLPDPNDRHVLAAAVRAGASVIVTFNLSDFPAAEIARYGVEAQHPDEFVRHLLDLNRSRVCAVVEEQRGSLRNPPKTTDEFLDILLRQSLP